MKLYPFIHTKGNEGPALSLYYGFVINGKKKWASMPIPEVIGGDDIMREVEDAKKEAEVEIKKFLEENKDKDIKSIKSIKSINEFPKNYKDFIIMTLDEHNNREAKGKDRMKKDKGGSPEKKNGGVRLSKKAIQEIIRGDSRELIDELLMLAKMPIDPKTISTKVSAIRIALAKVVPDLKASEIKGDIELIGPVIYKPSTFNENMETVSKAGDST